MSSEAPTIAIDVLEACLRAVLTWHEQSLSSASLRSRVGGDELWSVETLAEAADSLGYDVTESHTDNANPSLPALPAICATHVGTFIAVLAYDTEGMLLVVYHYRIERRTHVELSEVLGQISVDTLSLARRQMPPVAV